MASKTTLKIHGNNEEILDMFDNEIVKEYVGYIVEEKKKLQHDHHELEQQVLKLQQSYQSLQEHAQCREKEMEAKDKLIKLLENEITALTTSKEVQDETINTLEANILECKNENEMMYLHNMNVEKHTISHEATLLPTKAQTESQDNAHDEIQQLKREIHSFEAQQISFKTIISMHRNELRNIRKHNDEIEAVYLHTKHVNEQQQIEINTKSEFMERLKEQNEKLQSSNTELLRINSELSDHQHTNKQHENNPIEIYEHQHEEEQEQKSNNLEMILPSIRYDEYKLNEDIQLKTEKQQNERIEARNKRIRRASIEKKRCVESPSDAEKEFFFMLVWTIKLEISTSREAYGMNNGMLSDLGAQTLWIKAHAQSIPMHKFYPFIKSQLLQIAMKDDKECNKEILHRWSSSDAIINGQTYKKRSKIQTKTQKNTKMEQRRRMLARPIVMYSDQQMFVDEEEEEHPSRDSHNLKKVIIDSFNELQQQHV